MFNFGKNWQEYSKKSLDQNRFEQAIIELKNLIGPKRFLNKSFLDIGCGSGIHSLAAAKLGFKKVLGLDISKESIQISNQNKKRFWPNSKVTFKQENIFNLKQKQLGKFDVVYSWGVLHHTGNMKNAIEVSTKFVGEKGLFVIAIYNKHWSSPIWWYIKKLYNLLPLAGQRLMVFKFILIIALAKFLVTGKNPFAKKRRGMSFYYDLIDWLGGFPYEYASQRDINNLVLPLGFKLEKFIPSEVPTGCHEYVFRKTT